MCSEEEMVSPYWCRSGPGAVLWPDSHLPHTRRAGVGQRQQQPQLDAPQPLLLLRLIVTQCQAVVPTVTTGSQCVDLMHLLSFRPPPRRNPVSPIRAPPLIVDQGRRRGDGGGKRVKGPRQRPRHKSTPLSITPKRNEGDKLSCDTISTGRKFGLRNLLHTWIWMLRS
uniref:Uncharacterized protein n=1 Tax=Knipowitschia caucasica TaxID=637954 RepID=A0AAV2LC77_KNICA